MNRKLVIIIGLILLASFVFSEGLQPSDLAWNGAMSVTLDKETFMDGETITGHVRIANKEEYPIIGGILVLQIAQGEYEYPSQSVTNDNVLFEKTIKDIWVLPNTVKDIDFNLGIVQGGEYRADAYLSVLRSKHTGASWIFMSPLSKEFNVEGEEYKRLQIFRPLTNFNGVRGPVGFPVEGGEEINGEIFITNETGEDRDSLQIGITICDWSTGFCEKEETLFDIGTIKANQTDPVNVKVKVPTIPSAYAINIKLYNGDIIESIYKSRVIVAGGTAKLRKMLINGFKEKDYSLLTIFSGSPDHFNYPPFNNFSLGMKIYSNTILIQEEKVDINNIDTSEIKQQDFDIKNNIFDRVCLEITKQSVLYDEFCFDVELEAIQEAYDLEYPEIVQVDWSYNEELTELTLALNKSISINSRVRIIHNNQIIFEDSVTNASEYEKIIFIQRDNMVMLVDDFDAKNQQTINLNLALDKDEVEIVENGVVESSGTTTITCSDKICDNGFVCDGESYASLQGTCCKSTCVPAIESEGFNLLGIPFIFWIAIIILLAAIAVVGTTVQKVKHK
ncbi:MAG: hypothetical protein HON47_03990 [Candidatus Diapherotrites archaeon]|uniref:Uncharacterized protein n=1 Tax=Candidatus Iainarchaeum sp. TaxID=3101447 RepID=A0A8T5GFH0_9ARCH|nr:hypothetical protein [Candidatus Diapherotrites archaeon]MBT7241665.1 hypothetical protein [Candidatus Diapherotrites archaeon]